MTSSMSKVQEKYDFSIKCYYIPETVFSIIHHAHHKPTQQHLIIMHPAPG